MSESQLLHIASRRERRAAEALIRCGRDDESSATARVSTFLRFHHLDLTAVTDEAGREPRE